MDDDEGFEIAVVDDEEWVRRGLISKLSKSGLPIRNIKEFADGGPVLAYIKAGGRPDIMICDIRMPGLDGLQLASLVREWLRDLRVIISSGYGEFEYAKRAIQAGVSEYLLKPIDNVELFTAIRACMEAISLSRRNVEHLARLQRIEREDRARRSLCAGDLRDIFPAYGRDADGKDAGGATQFICGYFRVPRIREAVFYDLVSKMEVKFLAPQGVDNSVLYSCTSDEYVLLFLAVQPLEAIRTFAEALAVRVRDMVPPDVSPCPGILPDTPAAAGLSGLRGSADAAVVDARELMKYRILMDKPALISAGDIADYTETYTIPEHHISALRRALEGGNEKTLNAILGTIEAEIAALKLSYRRLEHASLQLFLPVNEYRPAAEGTALFMDPYKFGSLKTFFAFVRELYRGCAERYGGTAPDTKPALTGKAAVIRDIASSIDTHFNEYLTLDLFAADYGINSSYLSLLFKEVMGINFQDYLTHVRIRNAKEFLASGRFKVSEVAEKTGYTNRFYFSKAFKKIEGLSPSEFMGMAPK
ncbi:MAG: response regulator [Treponema sp.]|nr:response regulator [Treponema sp.]